MSITVAGRSNIVLAVSDQADAPPDHARARVAARNNMLVSWAAACGVILAVVGVIDGVVMALKRRVANCPDGTYFPEGTTDFNCYVHPQAGIGIGVAVISALLGLLVVLATVAARAARAARPSRT